MTRPSTTSDATREYTKRSAELREKIGRLNAALDVHAEKHQRHPDHWGRVGDLGRCHELVDKLLQFLNG